MKCVKGFALDPLSGRADVDAMIARRQTQALSEAGKQILNEPMRVPVTEHLRLSSTPLIINSSKQAGPDDGEVQEDGC